MTIRDGAAGTDADTATTQLTSSTLSVTGFQQIKTPALFDTTNTKLGEVSVTIGTVQFSGLNYLTPDNGRTKLILTATFKKQVTDNVRIRFKVTAASSKSDTVYPDFRPQTRVEPKAQLYLNDNKLNVIASKLRFVQQPTKCGSRCDRFPSRIYSSY